MSPMDDQTVDRARAEVLDELIDAVQQTKQAVWKAGLLTDLADGLAQHLSELTVTTQPDPSPSPRHEE